MIIFLGFAESESPNEGDRCRFPLCLSRMRGGAGRVLFTRQREPVYQTIFPRNAIGAFGLRSTVGHSTLVIDYREPGANGESAVKKYTYTETHAYELRNSPARVTPFPL